MGQAPYTKNYYFPTYFRTTQFSRKLCMLGHQNFTHLSKRPGSDIIWYIRIKAYKEALQRPGKLKKLQQISRGLKN